MKKTLLALSVLAAAGTAQAGVNLYDADGVTVDVSGAAEVQYFKDYAETQDAQIRLDDGDLEFIATAELSPNLRAIGDVAFKFEDSDMANDVLAVGLEGDFGKVMVGRMCTIGDDQGNTKDIELAGEKVGFEVGCDEDQVFKYTLDMGQFYGGVDAAFDENGSEQTAVDVLAGVRFGDFDARVFYQGVSDLAGVNGDDVDQYSIEVDYVMGALELAAGYAAAEYDQATGDADDDGFQVSAAYTVENTTFAGGYVYGDLESEDVEADTFYVNVTQSLHSNVKVYAEVGYSDQEVKSTGADQDTDVGYVVGMEVVF